MMLAQYQFETGSLDYSFAEGRELSHYDVLKIASLVEREAYIAEERALISAVISNDFTWQWLPPVWSASFGDALWSRLLVSLLGGLFLGFGARWADGCTSGHGISGTMQLAVSGWVSAICFFIGGILVAQVLYKVIA